MNTQARCPDCNTVFQVSDEQLKQAVGRVRCGQCLSPFNVMENLADEDEISEYNDEVQAVDEPLLTETEIDAPESPRIDPEFGELESVKGIEAENVIPDALADDIKQASIAAPRSRLQRFVLFLLVGGLLCVAALQYLWFMPADALQRLPEYRTQIETVLERFDRLPLPERAPQLVTITHREVSAHPSYTGALMVKAGMLNKATFAQPYPELRLTLFDINGQVIAQRDFKPGEYLLHSHTEKRLMPSGEKINLELQLASPETLAVSFEFTFL